MAAPRFLADEDFRFDIVQAVRNLDVAVDIVTVQEAGLGGMDDQDLLEIAAASGQILISHDRNSMTAAAAERLQAGHEIAGLVLVPQHTIRSVIAETIVMIGNSQMPTNG